jgi:hypothetical protein
METWLMPIDAARAAATGAEGPNDEGDDEGTNRVAEGADELSEDDPPRADANGLPWLELSSSSSEELEVKRFE